MEDNGSFALTFALPHTDDREDSVAFTGARELTYRTTSRDNVERVRPGDIFYLELSKSEPT
jgi:hypothetical protein